MLETHGITDIYIYPTKTPAEVRPVHIAEDPLLTTDEVMLCRSTRGSLPSINRCTTMGLISSENAGDGDDLRRH